MKAIRRTVLAVLLIISIWSVARLVSRKLILRGPSAREFIAINSPSIAITHVRVIDGNGNSALEDQTIVIEEGKIVALGFAKDLSIPAGSTVLSKSGYTVMPGLIGMHDHLFYQTSSNKLIPAGSAFARLYLGSGVTTIRTAGAIDLDGDLRLKHLVDSGDVPGPNIHISSPYLPISYHAGPDATAKIARSWISRGVTSFKAYTSITRSELAALIATAHENGFKVTGHLCSVGFQEAISLGIDNLEHGILMDTEFYSGKQADICPEWNQSLSELSELDVRSQPVQKMIASLVAHHVAVTSTLAVFETFVPNRPVLQIRTLQALSPDLRNDFITARAIHDKPEWIIWQGLLKKEMQFEREFVKRGGLLVTGADPTGYGGVLAGFGDQRGLELLVEAGFTPLEAIRINTANGAALLGISGETGTIAIGKRADMLLIKGDPSSQIRDVEIIETVFKNGIGYDSQKLISSVWGKVGN